MQGVLWFTDILFKVVDPIWATTNVRKKKPITCLLCFFQPSKNNNNKKFAQEKFMDVYEKFLKF